jgi:hypothetical protein
MLSDTLKTLFDLEQVFGGGAPLCSNCRNEWVKPASPLEVHVLVVIVLASGVSCRL